MKKTLLATAVTALFAASGAQAATVYDKDGVTVELYGDTEVVFMSGLDSTGSEIDIQDTDFGFTLGYDLGNDYVLGTTLAFAAGGGAASVDEAYVSAGHAKWGTLSVGKQYTVYDSAGIGNDYQFGGSAYYDQADAGEQVVKYSIDMESFYGDVAWIKNTEAGTVDGADGFDARIGARFDGLDAAVYFADVTEGDVDYSNVNLQVTYEFDAFTVGAAYVMAETDDAETDAITVIGIYQFTEKAQFAGGVSSIDADGEDALVYYVNTSYAFNDHINTYLELGGTDVDDSEIGYAAGMQVSF